MKIKVKIIRGNNSFPTIIKKGDWIDLHCAKKTTIVGPMQKKGDNFITFNNTLIPLGVAMQLPKGFEAHVLPRSSTYKYYGVMLTNSMGIIDNSYNSNTDEWQFGAIAFKTTTIPDGDRICQFRIELSQKATVFQKIRWIFTRKIKFVEVNELGNIARGGFGTTGVK